MTEPNRMSRFLADPATYRQFKVAELGELCKILGIPTLGVKDDKIQRIVSTMTLFADERWTYDLIPNLRGVYNEFAFPTKEIITEFVRYIGAIKAGTLPSLSSESADFARIRAPKVYDLNVDKFREWLKIIHETIKPHMSMAADLASGNLNPNLYGRFPPHVVYHYMGVAENPTLQTQLRRFTYDPVDFHSKVFTQESFDRVTEYLGYACRQMVNRQEIALPIPEIDGAESHGMHFDQIPGTAIRLPYLRYEADGYMVETLPFGLRGAGWKDCVMTSGGHSIELINTFKRLLKDKNKKVYGRLIMNWISRNPGVMEVLVINGRDDSPFDHTLEEVVDMIVNLPTLSLYMFGTDDPHEFIKQMDELPYPKTNLTPGQRQAFFAYLAEHPEVRDRVTPPQTFGLPFCIEDYIDPSLIPAEFKQSIFVPKTAENVYLRLNPLQLRAIGAVRMARNPANPSLEVNADLLWIIDEMYPEWKRELPDVFQRYVHGTRGLNISEAEVIYMAASLDLRVDDLRGIPIEAIVAYAEIMASGGFGSSSLRPRVLTPFVAKTLKLESVEIQRSLLRLLGVDAVDFISERDYIKIIRRGYINPLPITPKIKERVELWAALSYEQKVLMSRIYSGSGTPIQAFVTANPIRSKLEDYVRYFKPKDESLLDIVIQKLKMIVPSGMTKAAYVEESLPRMVRLFERKGKPTVRTREAFNEMTDVEVYEACGAFFGHQSFEGLRDRAFEVVSGTRCFFLPIPSVPNPDWVRTPQNRETIGGSEYSEISDPKNYYIYWGTPEKYWAYDFGDIEQGFKGDEESGLRAYRMLSYEKVVHDSRLGDIGINYQGLTGPQVRQLKIYLKSLPLRHPFLPIPDEPTVAAISACLVEIERAEVFVEATNKADRDLLTQFNTFSEVHQKQIAQCFENIFFMGMYFRRWQGPGHPFPLKSKESQVASFDTDASTVEIRLKFIEGIGALPPELQEFVMNVFTIEHRDGEVRRSDSRRFNTFWDQISGAGAQRELEAARLKGEEFKPKDFATYCIRMASSILVGTGYHYGKLFYGFAHNEDAGYDPTKVEFIA